MIRRPCSDVDFFCLGVGIQTPFQNGAARVALGELCSDVGDVVKEHVARLVRVQSHALQDSSVIFCVVAGSLDEESNGEFQHDFLSGCVDKPAHWFEVYPRRKCLSSAKQDTYIFVSFIEK